MIEVEDGSSVGFWENKIHWIEAHKHLWGGGTFTPKERGPHDPLVLVCLL